MTTPILFDLACERLVVIAEELVAAIGNAHIVEFPRALRKRGGSAR
jgi:hypothetical protein